MHPAQGRLPCFRIVDDGISGSALEDAKSKDGHLLCRVGGLVTFVLTAFSRPRVDLRLNNCHTPLS